MSWVGPCVVCGKTRRGGVGIFCRNFCVGREGFPPCMNVWCGGCYRESPTDPFPRMEQNDVEDESEVLLEGKDGERYRVGRNGDHLAGVPFECDLCHFRNLNRRDPVWDCSKDTGTLEAIRRVLLDVFWAREEGTVKGNLGRMRRDYADVRSRYNVGDRLLPYFPTHILEDRVGMAMAITMLTATLREGNYGPHIQYATARKSRTWQRNIANSASGYLGDPHSGKQGEAVRFQSCSVTDREWFQRFCTGMKWRMGEVRFQNEALTPAMVLGLGTLLDGIWETSDDEAVRESVEELMCYVLIGFGAGLRGEEVPLTALAGLLKFWDETRGDEVPYVMVTLYGRFKGETGFRWHCLPVVDRTRSGLPNRLWLGRLMRRRVGLQRRTKGWLFSKGKGRRARISDYDADFLYYLGLLQERRPKLFSKGVSLGLFSLRRSMRRGAILATTGRVSEVVINLMNRWRKKEGAKGAAPGLSMHQTYVQMRSMFPVLKEYSQVQ